MKVSSNKDINKGHKKLPPSEAGKEEGMAYPAPKMHLMKSLDKPVKYHLAVLHQQIDNPKMLTEKNNDEKLAVTFLIFWTGLVAYNFWEKMNDIIIIPSRWWCGECISL